MRHSTKPPATAPIIGPIEIPVFVVEWFDEVDEVDEVDEDGEDGEDDEIDGIVAVDGGEVDAGGILASPAAQVQLPLPFCNATPTEAISSAIAG